MSPVVRTAGAVLVALALITGCGDEPESESRAKKDTMPTSAPSSTDDRCEEEATAPDPEPVAEITDVSVAHTHESVVVVVRFSGIDPALEHDVSIHLATPRQSWSLDVSRFRQGGTSRTNTFFAKAPAEPDLPDGDSAECVILSTESVDLACRVRGEFDLDQNSLHATVPRSCMSNPAWVRAGVEVSYIRNHEFVGSAEWDAGADTSSWLPALGPKVQAATGAAIGCQKRAPRVQDEADGTTTVVVGKRPCIG